ncbi:hypothetical protein SprV_0100307500 [Sparganum proliferum]
MSLLPGNTTLLMLNDSKSSFETVEYQCTEIVYLNATLYERAVYKVAQTSQLCSYVLCILCVACLYILIYRSVLKMQKKHAKLTGRKFSRRKRISCPGTSTVLGSPETTKISTNKEKNSFVNSGSLGGENTVVIPDESECARDTTPCVGEECEVLVNNVTVTEVANSPNGNGEKMSQNVTQQTRPLEEKNTGEEIWLYNPTEANPVSRMPRGRFHRNYSVRFHQQQEAVSPQVEEQPPARQDKLLPNCNQVTSQPAAVRYKQGVRRIDRGTSATKLHSRRLSIKSFKDTSLFQNMKMAGMLFVVAIVYILTFIPAMLMASDIIALFLPVFYLYYVNNAVNPIIYCFMNPNFRADIRTFLKLRADYFGSLRR